MHAFAEIELLALFAGCPRARHELHADPEVIGTIKNIFHRKGDHGRRLNAKPVHTGNRSSI
jgi:hypothetical protein